jgi:thiol-disulfide isomerase/thioredoxin
VVVPPPPPAPEAKRPTPRPAGPSGPPLRPETAPRLGAPFPPFAIDTSYGQYGARNLAGRTTVLLFWDSSCSDCLQALPAFGSLARRLRAEGRDVAVVGIGLDEERAAFDHVFQRTGEKVELMWAPALREPFAITSLPTVWVVDPAGTARLLFDHWLSASELETHLKQLE